MSRSFHGTWWDQHRRETYEELSPGRFTKPFPRLAAAEFDLPGLERLAVRMTSRQDHSPTPEDERDPK
jgi:hypothetical protein